MATTEKKSKARGAANKSSPRSKSAPKTTASEKTGGHEGKSEKQDKGPKRAQLLRGDQQMLQTPQSAGVTVEPVHKPSGKKYTEKSLILVGTWVTLADTKNVPVELVGHEAVVSSAPIKTSDGDEQIPFRHQYQDEDSRFTVQTRDEYSAVVPNLTVDDFQDISYNGRAGLLGRKG
jgi:hypothetical protein